MASSAFDDDLSDDLKAEEVERRREPRGIFRGLSIEWGQAPPLEAVEASRRGFFVHVNDPESFLLGEIRESRIKLGVDIVHCRLEVVRKEIEPRRGVALRIAFIDPLNEELLKRILGPAG